MELRIENLTKAYGKKVALRDFAAALSNGMCGRFSVLPELGKCVPENNDSAQITLSLRTSPQAGVAIS